MTRAKNRGSQCSGGGRIPGSRNRGMVDGATSKESAESWVMSE